MTNRQLLTARQASAYLGEAGVPRTVSTLAKLRHVGGGPAFHRFSGRSIRYRAPDLARWIDENLSPPLASTSDRGRMHDREWKRQRAKHEAACIVSSDRRRRAQPASHGLRNLKDA